MSMLVPRTDDKENAYSFQEQKIAPLQRLERLKSRYEAEEGGWKEDNPELLSWLGECVQTNRHVSAVEIFRQGEDKELLVAK